MAGAGEITLGQDGLPCRGNGISAAMAYSMMADRNDCAQHIQEIYNDLLANDIWCWTKGAIEAHLELQAKSAAAHCDFLNQYKNEDFRNGLVNYGAVREMVQWATI